ncbi:MAG: thioesterase domain-containing protein, partial [Chloroflexota bacterium]
IGVIGQLYVGGTGISRGYLRQPRLTAEKFIPNPFLDSVPTDSAESNRLYTTGDLARYLPDGNIEFLGRVDRQVSIRGYRIELGEIEAVLSQHTAIDQTVVLTHDEEGSGDTHIVAYLTSTQEKQPSTETLRDFLDDKLSHYMVPSAFIWLDQFPLNPNGKIDKKALPAPTKIERFRSTDYVPSRDDVEAQLIEIWEHILPVKDIGVYDNFFELGGNSLLAVQLFRRIEQVFDKKLPLAILFEAPTLEQLGDFVRDQQWQATLKALVPIQPEGDKPIFYCIHAVGGRVLSYYPFVQELGLNQPVYGLQWAGHTTIEEMADYYVQQILKFQPEGPYFFGGLSTGGMIAFEMARQLNAQGKKVGLVALFDSYGKGYLTAMPRSKRLQEQWMILQKKGITRFTAQMLGPHIAKLKARMSTKQINNTEATSMPEEIQEMRDTIEAAENVFNPQFYPGKVTLFRARNQPIGIHPDPTLGWGNFVEELEIQEYRGVHDTMNYPDQFDDFMEKFTLALQKAHVAS